MDVVVEGATLQPLRWVAESGAGRRLLGALPTACVASVRRAGTVTGGGPLLPLSLLRSPAPFRWAASSPPRGVRIVRVAIETSAPARAAERAWAGQRHRPTASDHSLIQPSVRIQRSRSRAQNRSTLGSRSLLSCLSGQPLLPSAIHRLLRPARAFARTTLTHTATQLALRSQKRHIATATAAFTRPPFGSLLLPLLAVVALSSSQPQHTAAESNCDSFSAYSADQSTCIEPTLAMSSPVPAATPAVADASAPTASGVVAPASGRSRYPTFFLTHGGGPSYFMTVPPSHPFYSISAESPNAQWLRDFTKTYGLDGAKAPKAIVVVSAHWVTRGKKVRISNQAQHKKLQYDYGGFPAHTYKLEFNPRGSPELSARIASLLTAAHIPSELDSRWDFDHGVFIPAKMIWPGAEVPVVELSIDASYDPAWHLAVGKALRSLKDEGVLLIGSGSSTHNFHPNARDNQAFMAGLQAAVEDEKLSADERDKRLVLDWESLSSARKAHPEEDHLVPLFVVVGAAGPEQKGKIVGKVEPAGSWCMASVKFE